MARKKKDGARAKGVHAKKGYLYLVESQIVLENGEKKSKKIWSKTQLTDTPENVVKAVAMRNRRLKSNSDEDVNMNISISDLIELELSNKKREVSDTTYSSYFYRSKRIKDYFGSTRVRDITKHMVESFLDSLLEEKDLQPRTVKDTKVFFGYLMERAFRLGIISENTVKEAVINKNLVAKHAKAKSADDTFFSYEQAQLFLERVRTHVLFELFYLTIFFGLRREEVLGLRWQAIDFENRKMFINHTVTKGMVITRSNTTKTISSKRDYPLTDEQIEMFRRLKDKEDANRRLFGAEYIENDYVFKHENGSPYYPDYPSKAFSKLIKTMPDLPQNITLHGLRSSCVSILVHQGLDVKSIQNWVGHADLDTTLRIYAKVKDKESKKDVSNTMKEVIQLKDYPEQQ